MLFSLRLTSIISVRTNKEDQDIGNMGILTNLAGIRLDEKKFKEFLVMQRYKMVHQQALSHAREEIGINSLPTFIISERIVSGLFSKEDLEREIRAAVEGKSS